MKLKQYAAGWLIFSLCLSPLVRAGDVATVEMNYEEELEAPPPYDGPRLVVNAAARKLKLYDHEKLVKTYNVAVGSSGYRTPLGDREMSQIIWNPWWIPPKSGWAANAKPVPPGGRNHPLGKVKMDLGGAILIHGTNKPNSVGNAASHGCMRMLTEEALELARYIQERITLNTDPTTYAAYNDNPRRSYHVPLAQHVPVSIVYEIAEIEGDTLNVYKDVYWRVRDKKSYVENLLTSHGYNLEKFDLDYLKDMIKTSNKQDLSLPLEELKLAYREKIKTAGNAYMD